MPPHAEQYSAGMTTFGSGQEGTPLREEANQWVARFAPLVMSDDAVIAPDEVRDRIDLAQSLQKDGPSLRNRLAASFEPQDIALKEAIAQAVDQLPTIEADYRKRLARVQPGDPEGRVDLDALRDRLASRAARQEVGLSTETEIPSVLDLETSQPSPGGAFGIGIFAFGWLSFTTFHMVLMIGGMFKAVGWGALALLGFYAIFYLAGIAMASAALQALTRESIHLEGRELLITRRYPFVTRTRSFHLAGNAKASLKKSMLGGASREGKTPLSICIQDQAGKDVWIIGPADPRDKKQLVDRLNAYFLAYPAA